MTLNDPRATAALAPMWTGGRGALRFLPSQLFRDRQMLLQIAIAWALSMGGSIVLGWLVALAVPEATRPDFGNAPASIVFVLITFFSPVIETIVMALILSVLARFLVAWQAGIASAAIWAILHSLQAPTWGLVIWWPFLIFSTVFLTWRHRGFWFACGIVMVIHMLQNGGPALAIVLNR